jgi:alpha-glucosidase
MFFMRSGYVGVQTYAPILWNGDQHTDTTKDYGMPCVMPASFSLGFSGVPMIHCDVGGFFSFGKMKRKPELFTRWMEMCAFSLLMRSHESIRPWANAQFDAPEVTPHTVRLTSIHAALKPYIKHCEALAKAGLPAMRPDFYDAMDYGQSHDMYSYFFGEDLYVCPVIERRAKTRKVHLPKGEWIGFWSGKAYAGETAYTVPAPLGQTPVFYRKNSAYADLFRRAAEENK